MKTLVELKWSNRSANMIKLDDIYQILELETNESLIVLPANNKIEEAVDLVLNKYDIYIEFLHWDNCGKLDGFIDHRNNMFILIDG